jgi:hypothetical protein
VKNHWLSALNIIGLVVFANVLSAFQTSLWMQVLGGFPPPFFWIVVLTYVILHRHVGEGVLMIYLFTLSLSAYTSLPFEQFLVSNMVGLVLILLVKNRIYWSSPNYFMLMTAGGTGIHFVAIFVLSQFLDRNPLRSPELFSWTISFLMTILVSIPLYRILKWWDRITDRDELTESTGGLVI